MIRKFVVLFIALIMTISVYAQLEVKENSFKEVPRFVNINTEKMYDDNDKPYAVLKIKTENIGSKERRELSFKGDAQTFFEIEYQDGEIWLYISYYATFLKISHEEYSSTEFYFPFDMQPKNGYELTLINRSRYEKSSESILIEKKDNNKSTAIDFNQKKDDIKVYEPHGFISIDYGYDPSGYLFGGSSGYLKRNGWFFNANLLVPYKSEEYLWTEFILGYIYRFTNDFGLKLGGGVKMNYAETTVFAGSVGTYIVGNHLTLSLDFVITDTFAFKVGLGLNIGK